MKSSSLHIVRVSALCALTLSIASPFAHAGPTRSNRAAAKQGTQLQLPAGIPGQVTEGTPADGAVGVGLDTDLAWLPSSNTNSYIVRFGTSPDLDAVTPLGTTTGLTYALDTLNWNTTYYWRIDSLGTFGGVPITIPGAALSFRAEPDFLPDLFPSSFNFFPTMEYRPGYRMPMEIDINNQGQGPAFGIGFETYLSVDRVITTDDFLIDVQTFSDLGLASGQSLEFIYDITLPLGGIPAGDYYIGCIAVDPDMLEVDLANNAAASLSTITMQAPLIDLEATDCFYDEGIEYIIGDANSDAVHVIAGGVNFGDLPADVIRLDIYLSTNSTITEFDSLLSSTIFFDVLPDEFFGVEIDVNLLDSSEPLVEGSYWIGVIVDQVNAIDERPFNNDLAGPHQITIVGPCLADLNNDGILDFFDISAFLTAFSNQDPVADFTGDMTFDFFDISAFLTAFGDGCP